jgi:hypothetical protein
MQNVLDFGSLDLLDLHAYKIENILHDRLDQNPLDSTVSNAKSLAWI